MQFAVVTFFLISHYFKNQENIFFFTIPTPCPRVQLLWLSVPPLHMSSPKVFSMRAPAFLVWVVWVKCTSIFLLFAEPARALLDFCQALVIFWAFDYLPVWQRFCEPHTFSWLYYMIKNGQFNNELIYYLYLFFLNNKNEVYFLETNKVKWKRNLNEHILFVDTSILWGFLKSLLFIQMLCMWENKPLSLTVCWSVLKCYNHLFSTSLFLDLFLSRRRDVSKRATYKSPNAFSVKLNSQLCVNVGWKNGFMCSCVTYFPPSFPGKCPNNFLDGIWSSTVDSFDI